MHDHQPSYRVPSWSVQETEARENTVWIVRLVSTILAAGWSGFWMAIACILIGAVATLALLQRPSPLIAPRAPAAALVAPAILTVEPDVQALREEVAALRERHAALEAREHLERVRAAAEVRVAEEARERAERHQAEEQERRLVAERERDQARQEVQRPDPPITVVAYPFVPMQPRVVDLRTMLMQQMMQQMAVRPRRPVEEPEE